MRARIHDHTYRAKSIFAARVRRCRYSLVIRTWVVKKIQEDFVGEGGREGIKARVGGEIEVAALAACLNDSIGD